MARHFSNWLKAYCSHTSASEAPLEFHFWTGVSTIAAVLRRRVWKDELVFKWTPNFYIIFVGPAGVVNKSTTLNLGYQILRNVKGIHFGPDSMSWHGLGKRFEAAVEYVQWAKPGSTVPTPLLMSPLTCSISELGTFLRPDDKGLMSFLTDVWDGKERPFDHGTKDSGDIKIENAWLNVIGATTPAWMQDNFPASLLKEGIGSRIVFVYADTKRHFTAYPSRTTKPKDYYDVEKKLTEDLEEICKLIGPYDLTDEAYKWGESWYATHNSGRATHMASERYGGYLARKQTHLHKLAMVLAAAKRETLVIEEEDLKEAEVLLTDTERSMIKVFESIGEIDEAKHIAEIMSFVRAYKWLTQRELYKLCHNIMPEREFKTALRIALEGDLLEVVRQGNVAGVSPKVRKLNS